MPMKSGKTYEERESFQER